MIPSTGPTTGPVATGHTVRLYYTDATLWEFQTTVREVGTLVGEDGAERPAVRLDRTAFYPTSGGQPYDLGTLERIPVVEVLEDATGEIWHLLGATGLATSQVVHGIIDWQRRFDHMQQHTGQHLLSAAFEDACAARTIGFHLGAITSTIDLDIGGVGSPELTWDKVFAVESAVNALVWQNRPVLVKIVDEDTIATIPLRKPPAVKGEIRVVWVEDYDASACGGTHVSATGAVGLIKVTSLERYKGGVRVGFVCGGRALRHYQTALHTLQTASLALSVGPDDLVPAIARLEEEARTLRRDVRRLRETMLDDEAGALWTGARLLDGVRVVVAHWADRDLAEVRALAGRLRQRNGALLLFAVTNEGAVHLLVARSDDLGALHAGVILRSALDELGGRGGGSATLAQGGTSAQPPDTILAALQRAAQV